MVRLYISISILAFLGYITFVHAETPNIQDERELECLAMNIYHEARSESLAGQYAVADVTLNRLQDRRYPNFYVSILDMLPEEMPPAMIMSCTGCQALFCRKRKGSCIVLVRGCMHGLSDSS